MSMYLQYLCIGSSVLSVMTIENKNDETPLCIKRMQQMVKANQVVNLLQEKLEVQDAYDESSDMNKS